MEKIIGILQTHIDKASEEIASKAAFIEENYSNMDFVFQWTQELLAMRLYRQQLRYLEVYLENETLKDFDSYVNSMATAIIDRIFRGPKSTKAEAILAYQTRLQSDRKIIKVLLLLNMNSPDIDIDVVVQENLMKILRY